MKSRKKLLNQSEGITLIALVITIIVLLILAGVTIVTLTGDNGLITKANEAKTETEKSALKEEIDLLLLQVQAGNKLEDIFGNDNVKKDGTVYEVSYKGNKFFVGSNNEYIEKVEQEYEGEWTFNQSTQTLTAYNGDLTTKRGNQEIGEIIIPNYYNGKRVKKIGYNIFMSNTNLTKLTISNGIEQIDQGVFYKCSNLTGDLEIPNSVTSIGYRAFKECTSLNGTLKLSNNLQTIGIEAFASDSNLTGDLTIPDSVTSIHSNAFASCGFNGKLKLSNSLQTITQSAFNGLSNIKGDLIIPDSITSIENSGFRGSGFDGQLKLSNNLQTIDVSAFNGCSKLTGDLIVPKSVASVGEAALTMSSINSIKFLNKDTVIYDGQYTIRPYTIKIIGYEGSTAESYATKYNRPFQKITD